MDLLRTAPIGVFDSGVGGLTVLQEVIEQLPNENLIYFGDTARLPYGNKSPQTVLRYTLENVAYLLEQKIKCLIIACFTASSHALKVLEQRLSIPVIGVIQSGLEGIGEHKRIAILGTESTMQSGVLQSLMKEQKPSIEIFPVACPLFVSFIEEELFQHPAMRWIAHHYFDDLKSKNIDAALLACTHYPLIKSTIQQVLGATVRLIEPAKHCAQNTKRLLASHGLLNEATESPRRAIYVSDDPQKFRRLMIHFLKASDPSIFIEQINF